MKAKQINCFVFLNTSARHLLAVFLLVFVFFTADFAKGQKIVEDINDDGKEEIVFIKSGFPEVIVYGPEREKLFSSVLFSKFYRGKIRGVVGNFNRRRKKEIIFFTESKNSSGFLFDGKRKIFFPAPSDEFFAGAELSAFDLEGDGQDEIMACGQNTCLIYRPGKKEAVKILEDNRILSEAGIFESRKREEAKVIYVDDGDTIFLDSGEEIRYIGVDTPEIDEPFYLEAANKNKELIYGRRVTLVYDQQKIDPHGRVLAYVFSNGTFINLELIKEGLAKTDFIYPNVKQAKKLYAAESKAKKEKKGLWR